VPVAVDGEQCLLDDLLARFGLAHAFARELREEHRELREQRRIGAAVAVLRAGHE
jgi:hypothetical protein